jgi:hypothetical protein
MVLPDVLLAREAKQVSAVFLHLVVGNGNDTLDL